MGAIPIQYSLPGYERSTAEPLRDYSEGSGKPVMPLGNKRQAIFALFLCFGTLRNLLRSCWPGMQTLIQVRIFGFMSNAIISVHLPDGAIREFPSGSTPHDVAMSISPRLAAAAIVAKVSPLSSAGQSASDETADDQPSDSAMYSAASSTASRLVDLSTPLTEDT